MKKLIALLGLVSLLSGCNVDDEARALKSNLEGPQSWVWAQFNTPSAGGGLDTYYYFGRVSSRLLQQIQSREVSTGLIFLEDVRYWSDDGKVEAYSDEIDDDVLAFRIENIARLIKLKAKPKIGFSYSARSAEEIPVDSQVSEAVEVAPEEG